MELVLTRDRRAYLNAFESRVPAFPRSRAPACQILLLLKIFSRAYILRPLQRIKMTLCCGHSHCSHSTLSPHPSSGVLSVPSFHHPPQLPTPLPAANIRHVTDSPLNSCWAGTAPRPTPTPLPFPHTHTHYTRTSHTLHHTLIITLSSSHTPYHTLFITHSS